MHHVKYEHGCALGIHLDHKWYRTCKFVKRRKQTQAETTTTIIINESSVDWMTNLLATLVSSCLVVCRLRQMSVNAM